jgi:hypothetical protein
MTVEHLLKIGTNPCITLIYSHHQISFFEQAAKTDATSRQRQRQ